MQIGNDPQRGVDRGKDRKVDKKDRSTSGKLAAKSLLFGDQMLASTTAAANESLDAVMSDVDATSKRFIENPTEDQFQRYQQAVVAFVKKAQGQAYQVSREFDHKNRLHSIVREVDKHVAEIQDQVMSAQGRPLELAARVREIRGFLMDMYI
ncbi:MAG: YaaR family protein [Candidatus Sericytochromatia bacterium]|nr:YaaR family protein [Candidatus Sericytochromatia bacterium]